MYSTGYNFGLFASKPPTVAFQLTSIGPLSFSPAGSLSKTQLSLLNHHGIFLKWDLE